MYCCFMAVKRLHHISQCPLKSAKLTCQERLFLGTARCTLSYQHVSLYLSFTAAAGLLPANELRIIFFSSVSEETAPCCERSCCSKRRVYWKSVWKSSLHSSIFFYHSKILLLIALHISPTKSMHAQTVCYCKCCIFTLGEWVGKMFLRKTRASV